MMLLAYYFNSTKESWVGWGFLLLFVVFLFVFSAGIGPTAWFLGAEVSTTRVSSKNAIHERRCTIRVVLPVTDSLLPTKFFDRCTVVPCLYHTSHTLCHLLSSVGLFACSLPKESGICPLFVIKTSIHQCQWGS
ncbi:hypothetical protein COOONC_07777 [Cooperia oncophora]